MTLHANDKLFAFGKELTLAEWTRQPICRVGVAELARRLQMKEDVSSAVTRAPERGPRDSRFIGVSWHKNNQKWVAQIRDGKKVVCLGSFDDDVEAAEAYDERAARLDKPRNFPCSTSATS